MRYEKGDLATKYETTKESMTQMILLIAKMSEKVFITPPRHTTSNPGLSTRK